MIDASTGKHRKPRVGDLIRVTSVSEDMGIEEGRTGRVVWKHDNKMDVVFDSLDLLWADLSIDNPAFEIVTNASSAFARPPGTRRGNLR
jgi:hypothetical protein